MNIVIDMTAEDIAAGERNNSAKCPLALAARRVFRGEARVKSLDDVQTLGLCWCLEARTRAGSLTLWLPAALGRKIERYDDGGDLEPFVWEVNL